MRFSGSGGRRGGSLRFLVAVASAAALLGRASWFASAALFSSNVVALTSSNWKEQVLENPHMVLVNICREGWGYCQRLQPEWEKLAASVKGMVTIAYWDTQGGSRPPRLLGEYSGTPTIRLFAPKRKPRNPGSVAEKTVLDYQHGERNSKDLRKFLEYQLPNYVERVKFGRDDYDRFVGKAERFGLPLVVVFTTKATTSTTLKWLSAEYRRKLFLIEIPPTDKNQELRTELLNRFGDGEHDTAKASLYVVPPGSDGGAAARYGGDKFARRNLQEFLKGHALSEQVLEPIAKVAAGGSETPDERPKHDEF